MVLQFVFCFISVCIFLLLKFLIEKKHLHLGRAPVFSVIRQECWYHTMTITAMKVVKLMPLSYVNLKTKWKCFVEQLSLTWYRSSSYYLKITQSEAVTGTTVFIRNKTRQKAIAFYITGTLKIICQHYEKIFRKTFLTDAFQTQCIQKPKTSFSFYLLYFNTLWNIFSPVFSLV